MISFNPHRAIKTEPDETSQDDAPKENDVDEVIDEPSLIPENIIKVEIEEKRDSPSPVLQSESPRLKKAKIHLAPPKIPSPSEALRIHSRHSHSKHNAAGHIAERLAILHKLRHQLQLRPHLSRSQEVLLQDIQQG